MSKILILGGTGAMGVYLVLELAAMGHQVHVVSLDDMISDNPAVTHTKANAKDKTWLSEVLNDKYDAIVDFLIYSTTEFKSIYKLLLDNTKHYIFLSTYRVYADANPIREDSPRLLDVSEDEKFLATFESEYSLYKALQEDVLRSSEYDNWTIIRPAITYSKRRFQLVTLEADVVVYRAMNNLLVILPESALKIQGTMSWAGDVAKMLSRLILNNSTYCKTYTIATSEHHTWEEIANYYKEIIGLEYIAVNTDKYLELFGSTDGARYQLMYDRCFNRVVDNSKILKITGLKQIDFTSLKDGLTKELLALPKDIMWGKNIINERMNKYI